MGSGAGAGRGVGRERERAMVERVHLLLSGGSWSAVCKRSEGGELLGGVFDTAS